MRPFALKTNVKAIFLTAVCASQAFLFSCSSRNHHSTETMSSLDSIRTTITDLQQKARMYYSLRALDQLAVLAEQASNYQGELSKELDPHEFLFVLLADSKIESQTSPEIVSHAYMSGLTALSGNWWGTPGTLDAEMSSRFLAAQHSKASWDSALSNFEVVSYSGSETATLAADLKWTVADLAAGFLAEQHGFPYDWRAPFAQRKLQIEAIRKAVVE